MYQPEAEKKLKALIPFDVDGSCKAKECNFVKWGIIQTVLTVGIVDGS